ncbi:MAG: nucleotidyltransferase family protein [Clostridiales bacterium]|nr:nucleotidyltransferase family protein [Clostridiales bacterium]
MRIAAVICEYNPFHNGHKHQIDTARTELGCDGFIGLMSGNFVQRGEFAVFDKSVRAAAAISCGIDLVLENPTDCVLRSAEIYADCDGAEEPDLSKLKEIAEFFAAEPPRFKSALADELKSGAPFAAARAAAAANILGFGITEPLSKPNNLLAIEYLKALIRRNSSIEPVLIKRVGAMHDSDEISGITASATKLRKMLQDRDNISPLVPSPAANIYRTAKAFDPTTADAAILGSLCLMPKERLAAAPDISEGLENKIKHEVMYAETFAGLCAAVKSKRYAYSRIRRALLCAYLGLSKSAAEPPYVKILDFNYIGRQIISAAKKTSEITLAKNASAILKDKSAMKLWKSQLGFDRVYEIMSQTNIRPNKYL